jgi:hypothetical protein
MDLLVPRKKLWSPTEGRGQLLSPEGDVLWEDPDWIPNALMDEGEASILDVYFREQANVSKYLALVNGGTTAPGETDTMAYLAGAAGAGETKNPGTNGYARQQIVAGDWSVPALDVGDMQTAAAEKTFGPAATAAWTVTHVMLVTHATSQASGGGKAILFLPLAASTSIAIGQSFKYTLRAKAQ